MANTSDEGTEDKGACQRGTLVSSIAKLPEPAVGRVPASLPCFEMRIGCGPRKFQNNNSITIWSSS
jgi:hypothetical protein